MSYDESWDLPHKPTDDVDWQESDCYWAYDAGQGVGLFHRLGQYPNRGTAQVQLFVFRTGGQRFRQVALSHPGPRARGTHGQRIGNSVAESLGHMRMRYAWAEAGTEGDVEFYESFHTPRDWRTAPGDARYTNDMHDGGHLECSGRLRGHVSIGGEVLEIDALAHRDRSWGRRNLGGTQQHRMCTGTIGRELSWATVLVQFDGGQVAKMGFISRQGRTEQLSDVEFLTTVDFDSLSVTGALTRLHLADGEIIEIGSKTEQAFLNAVPGYTYSCDSVMSLQHKGAGGFCYHTATLNAARGTYRPSALEVSSIAVEDGLGRTIPIIGFADARARRRSRERT